MKKKILPLIACALLPLTMMLSSCNDNNSSKNPTQTTEDTGHKEDEDVVVEIEITSMPTKTEYKVGETFKTAGLKFDAIYASGEVEKNLTGGDLDSFSPSGPLTEDVTAITIYFEGVEAQIPIKVTPKTIKSVEITREPDIKTYQLGESLDLTGLVVAADYEEGLVDNETSYTVTDQDGKTYEQGTKLETAGDLELFVNVTSNGVTKSDSFTITIFDGITVQAEDVYLADSGEAKPTDKSYTVITGNNLDLAFNDGNKNTHLKHDSTFTGDGYVGDINVGMKIEFYIYSKAAMDNADIVLIASSTRTNNAELKMDDVTVNKIFKMYFGDDEEEIYLPDDLTIQGKTFPPAGSATTKWTNWVEVPLGQLDIVAGYNKVTLEVVGTQAGDDNYPRTPNIDRLEVRQSDEKIETGDFVTDVEVTSEPTKKEYEVGEEFDPAGLKFDVTYRNGYAGDKNLGPDAKYFSYSPSEKLGFGDDVITFTYKNYSWKMPITLKQPAITAVEIVSMPTNTFYTKGSKLDLTGLKVKATYANGYVDEDAKNYVIKDSLGNTYKNGDLLDKDYPSEDVTFTVEITSGEATKQATFKLNIVAGITVQAEDAYKEGETGATESYTVITPVKEGNDTKIKEGANGQTAIENIDIGAKIEFHIYSQQDIKDASLVLVAASLDRDKEANKTNDTKFNDQFSLTLDGQKVSVEDSVMIKGREAKDGESIWFLWTDNLICNLDLKAGYNVLTLDCTGKIKDAKDGSMRAANIDKIKIEF